MGAPKTVNIPKKNRYLAEFLGILFGDGSSYRLIKGTKIRLEEKRRGKFFKTNAG